jgi:hypothetical protein
MVKKAKKKLKTGRNKADTGDRIDLDGAGAIITLDNGDVLVTLKAKRIVGTRIDNNPAEGTDVGSTTIRLTLDNALVVNPNVPVDNTPPPSAGPASADELDADA